MKKSLNFAILVTVFSFLFFAAKAQNEGAIRMPEAGTDNNLYVEQAKIAEEVVPTTYQVSTKEVADKKQMEKKEIIRKVNDLKTTTKVVKADRIKKNLKAEKTTVSQNVKIAIILIAVGVILSVVPNFTFWFLGLILVVVGLVLLLLEIL
jgi:cysteinyl-tRNA synthetase